MDMNDLEDSVIEYSINPDAAKLAAAVANERKA